MIRAEDLNPESILAALDRADFYASTGVKIKKLSYEGKSIRVEIDGQEGTNYVTEYIGTLEGFNR